jgi:hypothetical protein
MTRRSYGALSYSNAGDKRWQGVVLSGARRIQTAISERGPSICEPQGLGFESLSGANPNTKSHLATGDGDDLQQPYSNGARISVPIRLIVAAD